MSERPKILPGVLAEISSSAPTRLQKRLDRQPDAANAWKWQQIENRWEVAAVEEQVVLKSDPVASVTDVACSCLLGPRCFHVLATLSVLDITDCVDGAGITADDPLPSEDDGATDHSSAETTLSASQSAAAHDMFEQCSAILATGMRATGTVLQSRFLRAIHECRAEGLHRLASAALRVMHNVRRLRQNDDSFDSESAEQDLLEALEVAWRLGNATSVATPEVVGAARRRYTQVNSLKLHGLCSEPLLTRSGYAGVVTYMVGEDGWICSLSDIQPGDASRILQAWKSGVSVAGLAISHRDLSRQCLLVSKATRSPDGRLGGASSAQAVTVPGSGWDAAPIAAAFRKPLAEQLDDCFQRQRIPMAERPAGFDLVFVTGNVMGCNAAELIIEQQAGFPLRLSISIDCDAIPFRENLTLLSRASGLRLQCVARVNFLRPGHLELLAIAPARFKDSEPIDSEQKPMPLNDRPELRLGSSTAFHMDIGLDELQRSDLTRAEYQPVEVHLPEPLDSLRDDVLSRWLRAIALGGRHAVPSGSVTAAVRDAGMLKRRMKPTAAALLLSLTRAAIGTHNDIMGVRFPADAQHLGTHWLAAAVANRAAVSCLQHSGWLQFAGDDD